MKRKFNVISIVFTTLLLTSCASPLSDNNDYSSDGILGNLGLLPFLLIAIVIIVAIKTSKKDDDILIPSDQTNKVVNVTIASGLIGLFGSSPQNALNNRIKKENANGWRVVQVIPADSGNIFLTIFRLLLLIFTLFLYTTANGYYVIMEKEMNGKRIEKSNETDSFLKCSKCGKKYLSSQAGNFCEECGNQL